MITHTGNNECKHIHKHTQTHTTRIITNPLADREEDASEKRCRQTNAHYRPTHISMASHMDTISHSVRMLCYYICKQHDTFYIYYKYMAEEDYKGHCRSFDMYPLKHLSSKARKQQIPPSKWVSSTVIKNTTRL